MKRSLWLICLLILLTIVKSEEEKCVEGIEKSEFASTEKIIENEEKSVEKSTGNRDFGAWMSSIDLESVEKIKFSTSKKLIMGQVGVGNIHALKDIKKGDPVYNFPALSMLSAHDARNDERVGSIFKEISQSKKGEEEKKGKKKKSLELTDPEIVKMYSIYLKHNENPKWNPYFDILPKTEERRSFSCFH
eukprot:TRINITY_DN2685_c0_g1_i2.p1 TRINITY_DN2685_c0_g1~~TRINITY_DN2685_c0_g1_i2.p1  ORF type:complete len:190 (-),score=55.55 TRINITY_DN2685_c0_g1_i2:65-634(-)